MGFYNRIALGALAVKKRSEVELMTLAPHLLENERIDLRLGNETSAIDTIHKTVHLQTGEQLAYDKLILATGAVPSRPPISGIESDGVHYLWSINDARRIAHQLHKTREMVVIGGGILGVEAALDLADAKKKVTLIEAANGLLEHHLTEDVSNALQQKLSNAGISVHTRELVSQIEHGDNALRVKTSTTVFLADLILVSAGVRPNISLATSAGLATQKGIVVNHRMETSIPDILACGNCVEQPQGGALLWNPAKAQGEIAGANAFHPTRIFVSTTYPIHLKNNTIPLFAMGDPHGIPDDAVCIQEKGAQYQKTLYVCTAGMIRYAVFLGDVSGHHQVEKMMRNQLEVPKNLPAQSSVSQMLQAAMQVADAGYLKKAWVCNVCGYTHEGDVAPGVCPVCNVGRDQFLAA